MDNKRVKPRKFTAPATFTIENFANSELVAETLEKKHNELFLFQMNCGVDLSKLNNQEIQLNGAGQVPYNDDANFPDKDLNTIAVNFSNNEGQYELIVPNRDGKLQCVKQKFKGHVLFSEDVPILEWKQPTFAKQHVDYLNEAKQRYYPFGSKPPPSSTKSKSKKRKLKINEDETNTTITNEEDVAVKIEKDSDVAESIEMKTKGTEEKHKNKKSKKSELINEHENSSSLSKKHKIDKVKDEIHSS